MKKFILSAIVVILSLASMEAQEMSATDSKTQTIKLEQTPGELALA